MTYFTRCKILNICVIFMKQIPKLLAKVALVDEVAMLIIIEVGADRETQRKNKFLSVFCLSWY